MPDVIIMCKFLYGKIEGFRKYGEVKFGVLPLKRLVTLTTLSVVGVEGGALTPILQIWV